MLSLIILFSYSSLSLPILVGYVLNASDGEVADGYPVILYRPTDGISENQTNIIGSWGIGNVWSIDCLRTPVTSPSDCQAGDVVRYHVLLNISNYTTERVDLTITQQMIDDAITYVPNLTLIKNRPPNMTFHTPQEGFNITGLYMINVTVTNASSFEVDTVLYKIFDGSTNYSKDATAGFSYLYNLVGTDYYNDSFNTSKFSNGNYTLYIIANNTWNSINTSALNITINNSFTDFNITTGRISFSYNSLVEGENVSIIANISNHGNNYSSNVVVRFYLDNYTIGESIDNVTIDIPAESDVLANASLIVSIGTYNVWITVDPPIATGGSYVETNESNNVANNTFAISSWQIFVGNVSGRYVLEDNFSNEVISWNLSDPTGSHLFFADSDSSITFATLQAVTRNMSGALGADDFADIDMILNLTNNSDSMNKTYMLNDQIRKSTTFTIFGNSITNVPVINSTNSSIFETGILWDYSDDSGDEQYDQSDKEDIIFITTVNQSQTGRYGTSDFEVKIPAFVRAYITDSYLISIYSELK